MLRILGLLIAGLLAITVLRSVIGMIAQFFGNATMGPEKEPRTPRPPSAPRGGSQALIKDPVCGTFVTASTPYQKQKDGQTVYFCSADCRDRFAA